jgi:hypothetical protein
MLRWRPIGHAVTLSVSLLPPRRPTYTRLLIIHASPWSILTIRLSPHLEDFSNE